MDYASSVYSFNLHSLLPVCFSPLYLLSISWCPLSLRFTLSHPVSVNLIYLLLTLTLSVFFLRWLGPSCPPSAPHFLRLFTLKTALWATHSFGSLSTHGGCIDSPISAEMLAGLDLQRDGSTWQEGSLSSLLCYMPEVAVAHFKASANPSHSSSILSFFLPPQHPPLRTSPRHLLKSSSACLSASSAFKIQEQEVLHLWWQLLVILP